jgi:hypothetical protein
MNLTDTISGLGVLFILLGFVLTTFKRISSDSRPYFIINIIGGILAFWGSILLKSVPFAVLEGIWTIVALYGLAKSFRSEIGR